MGVGLRCVLRFRSSTCGGGWGSGPWNSDGVGWLCVSSTRDFTAPNGLGGRVGIVAQLGRGAAPRVTDFDWGMTAAVWLAGDGCGSVALCVIARSGQASVGVRRG